MIQLQRLGPQIADEEGFSRSGIRSFHEYVVLARIPQVDGVAARVVEALDKRIGHSPMAIEQIADDLNLSKRTLQRRLQQQDSSFAQLRDSLRFHYAIKYLIDDHMSVDAVSTALDFSDRTSFTNAFKRWTNLSPSVFRKLFRDYA
ncbi:AraC family transcriptional regulator [Gilvimarinus agarilyticus]|uniref:helix-turn-helix domain-containing protein n=1 Tax=unclassified Gilvimarinus TaxID=2642066 RepID=UPI001C087D9C|nr:MULTISPECIES: AraC family transcriptional regulator [unclassified Gilvimarinus]MBU2887029.1 AraC family transcriptional regulator [Gilvimarinus agarilyticus]MDO6571689.1 AraC family transcriptional regulator [Gilvimarinus sp. 2_MG-2023]MDO6745761.1 AraC family transcriptional regulator [Gilvimarinus sp. 1_MG-2023]